MENQRIYKFLTKKSHWIWHLMYWCLAAALLFFIFSNRSYDFNIRIILVTLLVGFGFLMALFVNQVLVKRFLFMGRIWLFVYLVIAVFIFGLWLSSFSVFAVLMYSAFALPDMIIPQQSDIIVLITGVFLVVIMAIVIHFIKESFQRLTEKKQVEEQKHATEKKLQEASLKILQSQIHPHFMFNMLNNLYALVAKDKEATRETIMKLSDLLDYMLYQCDKELITVQQEINFIHNYIALERLRYGEKFEIELHRDENATACKIPPLVLFPFVENAFKHGFRHAEMGFLRMSLSLNEEIFTFICQNSIAGKPLLTDKYLQQEGSGIGLKNIIERLEIIYSDAYELKTNTNENTYTVTLKIRQSQ